MASEPNPRDRFYPLGGNENERWVYMGPDNYMGEITYEFVSPDGKSSRYVLPRVWHLRFAPHKD